MAYAPPLSERIRQAKTQAQLCRAKATVASGGFQKRYVELANLWAREHGILVAVQAELLETYNSLTVGRAQNADS